jgi:hypothetical protein
MAKYTIPLAEAKTRITAWKTDQGNIQNELNHAGSSNLPCLTINAFTFELQDLTDLLVRIDAYNKVHQTDHVNAVRFYLGKSVPSLPEVPYACLVGVGVSNFSPVNNNGGEDILTLPPTTDSSIYDFSFPCPSTCAEVGHSIMDQS